MAQLTVSMRRAWRWADSRFQWGALLWAALLVGAAIATGGAISQGLNGAGGLLWLAAAASVVAASLRKPGALVRLPLAFGLTLGLVLLVRPSDILWATVGFGLAGASLQLLAGGRSAEWALVVPALWLPTHLLVAITRVVERSVRGLPAHVRTSPPPTAALVPFAMVAAALIWSALVMHWQEKRKSIGSAPVGRKNARSRRD
ncbi:MAG: hypothetical protein ACR2OO_04160 [Thermomicrobiales bacterium]